MHVIEVSEVSAALKKPEPLDREVALTSLLGGDVEQLGDGPPLVECTDGHALARAALLAFYEHHPLVLTPDAVWFTLAQGFAQHVAQNAERLRERFVLHKRKKKLLVERGDFFLGQKNPWPEVFDAFGAQIAAHVGKLRELVAGSFSTTGSTERAAFDVVLMDTFQPYFEHELHCGCGIPRVLLMGTADDWRSVRRRAAMLSEFELTWWTDALLPVLDGLVASAEGRADRGFWQSFFRYESGSGQAELTGWIQTFFPYLREGRNGWLAQWSQGFERAEERSASGKWVAHGPVCGPGVWELGSSVASAPVKFVDLRDGSEHALEFVAGLFGVSFVDGAVKPEFGWAVVHG